MGAGRENCWDGSTRLQLLRGWSEHCDPWSRISPLILQGCTCWKFPGSFILSGKLFVVLLKPDEPDCPNPLPHSLFDQHSSSFLYPWSDEPEHSLGFPFVGQMGFAIFNFLPSQERSICLILNDLDKRESQAIGPALKLIRLELILTGTDVCV